MTFSTSGIISAIGTFTDKDATGGTYFVGFLVMCIALGFCVAALADFFMLTKVGRQACCERDGHFY